MSTVTVIAEGARAWKTLVDPPGERETGGAEADVFATPDGAFTQSMPHDADAIFDSLPAGADHLRSGVGTGHKKRWVGSCLPQKGYPIPVYAVRRLKSLPRSVAPGRLGFVQLTLPVAPTAGVTQVHPAGASTA